MDREIIKADIYQYLKEKDSSRYDVIDIVSEISSVTRMNVSKKKDYYVVTCKVTYVKTDPISIEIEEKECSIDGEVLERYVREKNAVTWYE